MALAIANNKSGQGSTRLISSHHVRNGPDVDIIGPDEAHKAPLIKVMWPGENEEERLAETLICGSSLFVVAGAVVFFAAPSRVLASAQDSHIV